VQLAVVGEVGFAEGERRGVGEMQDELAVAVGQFVAV
jgi:hypothetical protein